MANRIGVLLADDHAMVLDALSTLLEANGIAVVGTAGDGTEAVELAKRLSPQLVIMDCSMPVMGGIEATEQVVRETGIAVIMLSMYSERHYVVSAFRAGVAAYVLKTKTARDLLAAIEEVRRGHIYLSPGISTAVVREMLHKSGPTPDTLTTREREVLQLVAEGKSNKEISILLGISVRTGESHRSRLMEKLNIRETAGLVRHAIREGLIQP